MKEDWVDCTLGDIGNIKSGGTPKTDMQEYWNGNISWITPADLSKYSSKYISKGKKSITKIGLAESSAVLIPKNSILFSSRAPIGYTVIAENELCTNQGFKSIIPYNFINSEFVYYYLKSAKQIAEKNASGTTFKEISAKGFSILPIPLPPLPIQRAIVSRIEALFSSLDKGISELKTAQEQLKIYRQAVLKKAFEGELTREWREQQILSGVKLPTAEELLEQIKEERKKYYEKQLKDWESEVQQWEKGGKKGTKPGKPKDQGKNKKSINVLIDLPNLPNKWGYYRLEDLSYLITDGTHFTPKYVENGIPFLSVKNVRPYKIKDKNIQYISEEEYKIINKRCDPQKGDILYTKVGATFGYACKINLPYKFSIFVSLCLIKPVTKYFTTNFVELLMNSEVVFMQARQRVSGSGVPDLHLVEIRDFKVPLCSLPEQNQIVLEIEKRLSVCDKMEETIKISLEKANALRQSILKKAFDGKLLSEEEIEACKREADYEPASVLLGRIQEEKEKNR
jgi:type I restriction enzyme S subunit